MTEPLPPIPSATPAPTLAVSVDGRIAEDKTCIDCGYNLRGLKTDGRCPECGGEVAASLRGYDLHQASLPWLRTVRRGFVRMKNSIAMVLWAFVAALIMEFVRDAMHPGQPAPYNVPVIIFTLLSLLIAVYALYGFIQATCVEPRIAPQEATWSARRLTRWLVIASLGLWGVMRLLTDLGPQAAWVDWIMMYLSLVLALLVPSSVAAFVKYVIVLLERTAEDKILKETKQMQQYVLLAVALAAVVLVINALVPLLAGYQTVTERLQMTASTASGCGSCINFIFAICALQLIWRCAAIMDRTVKAAELGLKPERYQGSRPLAPPLY